MRVLVVVGECLLENSSANLCHLKYIEGLVNNGHKVDLLTVGKEGMNVDSGMRIPPVHRIATYKDSLYKRIGESNKDRTQLGGQFSAHIQVKKRNTSVWRKLKTFVRRMYGPYSIETGWLLRAISFKEKQPYDLLISLSYPPVSHRLSEILILLKRISVRKWIQIWEDPWSSDLNAGGITDRIRREEGRIIGAADEVYYVSPLTMHYQKKLYPKYSGKMKWQPLPAYYEECGAVDWTDLHFGYFGDYTRKIRNLETFYRYADEKQLTFTICGSSDRPFASTEKIQVYPRLSLEELRPVEVEANVLVFVCNLRGGQIPGKIYQYSATNKYILFILDGTEEEKRVLYQYFNRFRRFVFCENEIDSIDNAVRTIYSGFLPASYRTALDYFSSKRILNNIIQGKKDG